MRPTIGYWTGWNRTHYPFHRQKVSKPCLYPEFVSKLKDFRFLLDPKVQLSADLNWSIPYIDLAEAHTYLATLCLTYLGFNCLQFALDPHRDIMQNVVDGDYFFYAYAETSWVHHVKHAVRATRKPEQLSEIKELLQRFTQIWRESSPAPTDLVSRVTKNVDLRLQNNRLLQFFSRDLSMAIMDYQKWNLTSDIGKISIMHNHPFHSTQAKSFSY